MKCYICQRQLSSDEIKIDPRYETFDPCSTCLDVIDSVFSHDSEEEISDQLIGEWGEYLLNNSEGHGGCSDNDNPPFEVENE